jgi:glutathione S-transferase
MSRRLYLSPRSPFARKVHILLLEKRLPFEVTPVDLNARTADFEAISPLGKVPVLRDGDGTVVFDSTVIAEYLEDRYPAPPMLGTGVEQRLAHRAIEELADTIADQSITLFFGKDHGPEALRKPALLLDKALLALAQRIEAGRVPSEFGLAHTAVRCSIDYMTFRLGRERLDAQPAIVAFLKQHEERASFAAAGPPRA